MGMAASQGRLLFMTARISNNEFEQQCVAYSKQRLADDSQEANDQYLEALQATQYQVLTGYNGDNATYEPVTYNQLTSLNAVAANKQYIVSDNKGQILVTKAIADAFGDGHNDFNTFLKKIDNLTQVSETNLTEQDVHDAWDKYFVSINKGDKDGLYYNGISSYHILGFSYHSGVDAEVPYASYQSKYIKGSAGNRIYLNEDSSGLPYYNNFKIEVEPYVDDAGNTQYSAYYSYSEFLKNIDDGVNMMQDSDKIYLQNVYVEYDSSNNKYIYKHIDENGNIGDTLSTDGNNNIYVKADMGANYLSTPNITSEEQTYIGSTAVYGEDETIFFEGSTPEQRDLYDYAMAITEKYATDNKLTYDADKVKYYRNIYQQMITKGYTTFEKMLEEKYINTMSYDASGNTTALSDEGLAFRNDNWLITLVKNGKLALSFYDINAEGFVQTTLDDDESIVEKENKSKIAIAEQVYQNHMNQIEKEDKRFDMQLSKLESEHTALTTEYESVSKVISKNVEKSFNVFNA